MNKTTSPIIKRFYVAWSAISEGRKVDFDINMLSVLVEDYNISAYWLLTGSGDMVQEEPSFTRVWLN